MANRTTTRGWMALTVLLIAGALLSLPPAPPSVGVIAPCNISAPNCDGSCDDTSGAIVCYGEPVGNASACSCVLTGCCRGLLNSTMCEDLVPQPACVDGIFVANGTCADDCRIPDGGACEDPADCASGNCVDDVCCDTACAGPEQQCNLPGQEGVCSSTAAPAPAASPTGLLIALALLVAVAAVAMLRRARAH